MTHEEAVILCRYVLACCPQQAIDEYTPDAWHDLLGDLSLADCRDAAAGVARRQPFVAPAEIRAEVRRIRNARIPDRAGLPAPGGPDLADDPKAWTRAMRAINQRLGDGQPPPFQEIEDGRAEATEAAEARDYQKLRQSWEAEQRAKKAAEKASRDARYAEEEAHSAAVRRFTEAYALLLVLEPEAQLDARNRAVEELGPDASAEDIAIRAAEIADYTRVAAVPIDDATRQSLARRGCPSGCPIGTHEPACRFYASQERTA